MNITEQTRKNLRCIYCGANPDMDLEELFECIETCTNCRVDLHGKGVWRDTSINILETFIKEYGLEYVRLTYQKYKFSKI